MDTTDEAVADRVVLSYRAPDVGERASEDSEWILQDSGWILEGLREDAYVRYIRVAHAGPVAAGEEWTEFVNCGCASPMDVILRVETVEGGDAIGDETAIEFVPRRDVLAGEATPLADAP